MPGMRKQLAETSNLASGCVTRAAIGRDRRGAVSIIFATTAIPLLLSVGLAIDYTFYVQAQAQLALAADTAAIHAVRIASSHFIAGESAAAAGADGAASGLQWFNAQLGVLSTGTVQPGDINIPPVSYTPATSTFTAVVNYKATIPTHFGGIFKAVTSWPLTGTKNAVITTNSYVEIAMLIDNSSSMLIGATPADIEALQTLTICPPTAIASTIGHGGNDGQYSEYSWNFPSNIGFTPITQVPPNSNNQGTGKCDPLFTGDPAECPYPPALNGKVPVGGGDDDDNGSKQLAQPVNANGYCPPGYGTPDSTAANLDSLTNKTRNFPQAPCGFACHGTNSTTDYYTLLQNARAKGAVINLRFDIIQTAAAHVVQTLQAKQQVANQFSLGVYTFNSAVGQVHPAAGGTFVEADNNLTQGLTDIASIATPAVADAPNTNFPGAMSYLATSLKAGGDGTTPATPRKNLFIITDGLEDYSPNNRFIGQMTSPLNETNCAPLKAKGFNIFVLYTPYYPLPNPFYLSGSNSRAAVEAPITNTSLSVAAGLQACATTPQQYYSASSLADIDAALQAMLASALNSPGRLSL